MTRVASDERERVQIGHVRERSQRAEAEVKTLRAFVEKMRLELDNAADAVGPVPETVERNLRTWSNEAFGLLASDAPDKKKP